jgi:dUTPase
VVKVLVKKLAPEVQLPNYKTSGASGVDLMAFINEPIKLLPNNSCLVPTGLSVAFSEKAILQFLIHQELLTVITEGKLKSFFTIMANKSF